MQIFFDESGDFGFPADRFDCYTQAAVICPDSQLEDLERFVRERCERWGVDELHAPELSPGRRVRLCRYLADSEIVLVGQATDTEMMSLDDIESWRLKQAQTTRANAGWYRDAGGEGQEILDWMAARAKSAEHSSRISDTEFVQAVLLVDLIHSALQKSILWYLDDRWRDDFASFSFILDGKLPGKLGPGEKYLNHALVPTLGSNAQFGLTLPSNWKDAQPPHPFIEHFEMSGGWSGSRRRRVDEDGIDVKAIFNEGLQFEPSHLRAGLQLADLVANVLRRAVLEPNEPLVQLAYNLLRPKLRRFDGTALKLIRFSTASSDPRTPRYRHLYRA